MHAKNVPGERLLEHSAQHGEDMLRTVIDQLPHWIAWKDQNSRYLGCNRAFAAANGVSTSRDVIGRSDRDFCLPETTDLLRREDEEVMRSGRPLVVTEQLMLTPSGDQILIEKTKLPLRSDAGDIVGVIVIATDVTERKRAEEQLVAAKQVAERAKVVRTRLFTAVSHDLRQPLQAASLFGHALAARSCDSETQHLIGNIQAVLDSAIILLDALMAASKLDTEVFEPCVGPVALGVLLDQLQDEFAMQATTKGLRFKIASGDVAILSDPLLLERILRNLIANAIRYTDRGGVLVACRLRGERARIEIWDTGIGIPADQHEHLFDESHQIQNRPSGGRGGMGLGLATVKRIAASLQHPITVRSRFGRGSVFAVDVPVLACEPPKSLS